MRRLAGKYAKSTLHCMAGYAGRIYVNMKFDKMAKHVDLELAIGDYCRILVVELHRLTWLLAGISDVLINYEKWACCRASHKRMTK